MEDLKEMMEQIADDTSEKNAIDRSGKTPLETYRRMEKVIAMVHAALTPMSERDWS